MSAGPQLERSVLEAKEREELHAIAQAMEIKTTSRTKKGDIIDKILEATGVSATSVPASSPEAPASAEAAAPTQAAPRPRTARRAPASFSFSPEDDAASSGAAADLDEEAAIAEAVASLASKAAAKAPASFTEPDDTTTEPPTAAPVPEQRTDRQPRPQQGQGQYQGSQQRNDNGYQNQPGNESGGRRNRRRRGRDRDDRGQGGAQDLSQYQGELLEVSGVLDLHDQGYGFVRTKGYLASQNDIYVSISQARRFALRKGDYLVGACRPAANNEKFPALLRIDSVSGLDPEVARNRPRFENLTPLFPDEKLVLETAGEAGKENLTARIVDLLSPIGKGQRGLIVSPPKAGKTTVMKQIAHSIEANNPEVYLMVLLVDERPEEVTDIRRSVKGEVIASTFDRPADEHTQVAELALERAKRLVEMGQDVVIILDGITRLARAYNLAHPATGRIMSGGVDSGALYPPKKFFGAARNIEEGGSLTILASALVDTGSKMDEVIFEEFKGTGNMELRLDRRLAERRLYPAIDVNGSSTRKEELLFDRGQLQQVWKLRRVLNALAAEGSSAPGLELLMDKIRSTKSNDEFLAEIAKGPTPNN